MRFIGEYISALTYITDIWSWIQNNQIVTAGITAVFVVGAGCAICSKLGRKTQKNKDEEISSIIGQFIEERNKSEIILSDLDIGVLGYSSDGVLINSNPAAKKMLGPDGLPDNLLDFLDKFGTDNGIQASMLLGNDNATGNLIHNDRVLRLRLKESRFDETRKAGTIIVIQDISDQEREERQRKEFVANVSHELKTPLTTIKTYSESLLDWGLEEKSPESVRKDIWRIHDDALRMGRLVEDLLLLSSIDSRGIRIRMEQLNVVSLIRNNVERMQLQAQEKDIELSCMTVSQIPVVFVDRTAVERVITNLLSNAIKYTERSGKIKVYIGMLVDDIYVKVSDTGFGIEEDHLPHIFKRFYRVDMTGSRMYGGTGLGLSIAKELVDLHHGKIQVQSVLGKGTEFTVMLPSARKIFNDTVTELLSGHALQDILYIKAAEELTGIAMDNSMIEKSLQELDENGLSDLLKNIYSDESELDGVDDLIEESADVMV
jgi:two-component system sensor histidine kinase VicK